MVEFAAFPPEINSGLMYAGPGAGPMTAASAAWDALADDLYLAAVGLRIYGLRPDVVVARSLLCIDGGRSRHLRVMDHRHRRAGCS